MFVVSEAFLKVCTLHQSVILPLPSYASDHHFRGVHVGGGGGGGRGCWECGSDSDMYQL